MKTQNKTLQRRIEAEEIFRERGVRGADGDNHDDDESIDSNVYVRVSMIIAMCINHR